MFFSNFEPVLRLFLVKKFHRRFRGSGSSLNTPETPVKDLQMMVPGLFVKSPFSRVIRADLRVMSRRKWPFFNFSQVISSSFSSFLLFLSDSPGRGVLYNPERLLEILTWHSTWRVCREPIAIGYHVSRLSFHGPPRNHYPPNGSARPLLLDIAFRGCLSSFSLTDLQLSNLTQVGSYMKLLKCFWSVGRRRRAFYKEANFCS